MNERKKGILIIIGIVLIGVFIQFVVGWMQTQPKIYTIGTVKKIYVTGNMKHHALYEYTLNNKIYQGSQNIYGYEDIVKSKEKFLVSIPKGFSSEGIILFEISIPDQIEAPPNGWDEKSNFKE